MFREGAKNVTSKRQNDIFWPNQKKFDLSLSLYFGVQSLIQSNMTNSKFLGVHQDNYLASVGNVI